MLTLTSQIARSQTIGSIFSLCRNKVLQRRPLSTLGLNAFSRLPLSSKHSTSLYFMQKQYYSSEKIKINLINRKGENIVVKASPEDTLLDVIIDNEIDIESFGVCEGTLGCSTCHVVLEESIFNIVDKVCPPTAEEFDMLDMACGLTETSRLGCQIEVSKELEGCTIRIPKEVSDARDL